MPDVFIYQICIDPDRKAADPGFLLLDNSANQRPDWFEYWPIRNYLLNEPLDEASFYGFVSPKFKAKTNLSATAAHDFVGLETAATDVVLMTPSLHWTAYHLNVFAFGDAVHPGLSDVAARFFEQIGEPSDLDDMVTDSRNEVYSNYLIAKPRFWRAWLEITEQLFAIAESPTDPLGSDLRRPTRYRGGRGVHMKIFIMERIATWLLLRRPGFVVRVKDPFVTPSRTYKLPGAILCDALKIAYLTSGRPEYKDVFSMMSAFGRLLSWQIKVGEALKQKTVRMCLKALAAHWTNAGRS